jgi:hypothetical protein
MQYNKRLIYTRSNTLFTAGSFITSSNTHDGNTAHIAASSLVINPGRDRLREQNIAVKALLTTSSERIITPHRNNLRRIFSSKL